jgi:putative SOS response-associated peptidase YedK
MCGKTAVTDLAWSDVFAWATSLTPPAALPPNPASRINVSPSRQRRKADPDSMIWETLPVISHDRGVDRPGEAIWPYLPPWSKGGLPILSNGKLLSTANARHRDGALPFAPTFMKPWKAGYRVIVVVSWFYEFDSRAKPQIPYAVFSLERPFWMMAALAWPLRESRDQSTLSTAIITVEPNKVLASIGHHRSPALLQSPDECSTWLLGSENEARELLRSHPDESMGVEAVPMEIKIPGNQDVRLPGILENRAYPAG